MSREQETKEKIAGYIIFVLVVGVMFTLGYVIGINQETREAQEIVDTFQQEHECRYIQNDFGVYNPNLITNVNFS